MAPSRTPPSSDTGQSAPKGGEGLNRHIGRWATSVGLIASLITIAGFIADLPIGIVIALWGAVLLVLLIWVVRSFFRAGRGPRLATGALLTAWLALGAGGAYLYWDDGQPASGASAGKPGVFHQTESPLSITCRSSIDLDAPPDDPTWRIREDVPGKELTYCADAFSRDLYVPGRATNATLAVVEHGPDHAACSRSTVNDQAMDNGRTRQGARACILTTENRWAFIEIVGIDAERRTIDLNIVVWQAR